MGTLIELSSIKQDEKDFSLGIKYMLCILEDFYHKYGVKIRKEEEFCRQAFHKTKEHNGLDMEVSTFVHFCVTYGLSTEETQTLLYELSEKVFNFYVQTIQDGAVIEVAQVFSQNKKMIRLERIDAGVTAFYPSNNKENYGKHVAFGCVVVGLLIFMSYFF